MTPGKVHTPLCRLCNGPAVARFSTPQGCVCRPNDREQDLCPQHIVKNGMIGDDVRMIADYRLDTTAPLFGWIVA